MRVYSKLLSDGVPSTQYPAVSLAPMNSICRGARRGAINSTCRPSPRPWNSSTLGESARPTPMEKGVAEVSFRRRISCRPAGTRSRSVCGPAHGSSTLAPDHVADAAAAGAGPSGRLGPSSGVAVASTRVRTPYQDTATEPPVAPASTEKRTPLHGQSAAADPTRCVHRPSYTSFGSEGGTGRPTEASGRIADSGLYGNSNVEVLERPPAATHDTPMPDAHSAAKNRSQVAAVGHRRGPAPGATAAAAGGIVGNRSERSAGNLCSR